MTRQSDTYDLGEIDRSPGLPAANLFETGSVDPSILKIRLDTGEPARPRRHRFDWRGSASIFVPGTGAMLRDEPATGLAFLCSMACLATSAWALWSSMDRLVPTLDLLGLRPELGVWILAAIFPISALLHIVNVCRPAPAYIHQGGVQAPYPFLSGAASMLVPGWGQLLNGDRGKSAVFMGGVWLVVAVWILSLEGTSAFLSSHGLVLPSFVPYLTAPSVRWTLPAVLWTLSVYDAVIGAGRD